MKFIIGIKVKGQLRNDVTRIIVDSGEEVSLVHNKDESFGMRESVNIRHLIFVLFDSHTKNKEDVLFDELKTLERKKLLFCENTWKFSYIYKTESYYIYPEMQLRFFIDNIVIHTLKKKEYYSDKYDKQASLFSYCYNMAYINEWSVKNGWFYFKNSNENCMNKGKLKVAEDELQTNLLLQQLVS